MKLTKDEARILAYAISETKYDLSAKAYYSARLFEALEVLEKKLDYFGKDRRRIGRTSQDDFSDLLKRFAADFEYNKNKLINQ